VQQLFPQAANPGKRTIAQLETDQDQSQGANKGGKGGGKGEEWGCRGMEKGAMEEVEEEGGCSGGGRVILNGVECQTPTGPFPKRNGIS